MVETIMPYGAINECCVKRIVAWKDEFWLVDDCGNVWNICESEFARLKQKGFEVSEHIRRR